MAKTEKKKISRIKVKKKIWYKISAPRLFGQKEIGEIYLASPEDAVGRYLSINLKDLTGNVRDQNAYIKFQIVKIEGNFLQTTLQGFKITPAYVKRMVRKNINRLDDYFTFKTKDGKEIVLKTLTLTLHKTHRSTKQQIRKQLEKSLQEEISKTEFNTLVSNIVGRKIQFAIKKKLSKIYPLKEVAVRVLQLKEKGVKVEIPEATPEVAEAAQ